LIWRQSANVADDPQLFDVVIVGGGPAGLSAALVLGRCRRRVLVSDGGRPRNRRAHLVRGYLGLEDAGPVELRAIGHRQLQDHPSVHFTAVEVRDAVVSDEGFNVLFADGGRVHTRKLLIASGMVDELPPIPGLAERWGDTVLPCPYCEGWELQDRRLATLGGGESAVAQCRALTSWSDHVALFTNADELPETEVDGLIAHGIPIYRQRVVRIEDADPGLAVVLAGDPPVMLDALFVSSPQRQHSPLVARLGCGPLDQRVETGVYQSTNVPGLFVAGDAAANVEFAIVAAAAGATSAFAINRELVREAFSRQVEAAPPDLEAIGAANPP
jgi:thioredoxin reductase